MKLAIGSDHAGYELKETVKEYLGEQGVDFKDFELIAPILVIIPTLVRLWPRPWPAASTHWEY